MKTESMVGIMKGGIWIEKSVRKLRMTSAKRSQMVRRMTAGGSIRKVA